MATAPLTRHQVPLRPPSSEGKPLSKALPHMILVEPRALFRECLSNRLKESVDPAGVAAYASLTEVGFPYKNADSVLALLLSVPPGNSSASDIAEAVGLAQCELPQAPIVVIAECEKPTFVRKVMSFGVQGYVPTSFDLATFKETIAFVQAGGTFVPASSLLDLEHQRSADAQERPRHEQFQRPRRMSAVSFTRRELDVVGQLREGKPNKLIARELSIGEGTVKLYLRQIMRKLQVNNRTQAALMVSEILTVTDLD
jgi:DNA-binding NarL/FixJ family response regulator